MLAPPPRILFAQHGWADTAAILRGLAEAVVIPRTVIIAPELGYLRTWHRIEPLIATVEEHVLRTFTTHPDAQADIIGHSKTSTTASCAVCCGNSLMSTSFGCRKWGSVRNGGTWALSAFW